MHSTDSLEDGYIGSGTRLWHSIKKHGRESFSIEILEFLPDRESLKKREAELVNEELIIDQLCMNLKVGGEGGWCYKQTREKQLLLSPEAKIKMKEASSRNGKLAAYRLNSKVSAGLVDQYFKGKHHTAETKDILSAKQSALMKGNARQIGCKMMYDPTTSIQYRVKQSDVEAKLSIGFVLGMSPTIKQKVSASLKEASKL